MLKCSLKNPEIVPSYGRVAALGCSRTRLLFLDATVAPAFTSSEAHKR